LLYTLGLLNEVRPYAVRFELARLLVIVPAGMLAIAASGQMPAPSPWLLVGTAAYIAASLAGLYRAMHSDKINVLNQRLIAGK
jgi:hypothetical protein